MTSNTFARCLMDMRGITRMSQWRLAELAEYNHSYISRLELGQRLPSRDAVLRLAEAMQLSADNRDRLLAFLADEAHWHRWRPERISEPCMREWALELRAGVRFLTLTEVADRCCVTVGAVASWIQAGILPAIRNGNHMVRESDLAGFVPPWQRSRAGLRHRRWSADDDTVLCAMRVAGAPYDEIARRLGRSLSSVANRWYRVIAQEDR